RTAAALPLIALEEYTTLNEFRGAGAFFWSHKISSHLNYCGIEHFYARVCATENYAIGHSQLQCGATVVIDLGLEIGAVLPWFAVQPQAGYTRVAVPAEHAATWDDILDD